MRQVCKKWSDSVWMVFLGLLLAVINLPTKTAFGQERIWVSDYDGMSISRFDLDGNFVDTLVNANLTAPTAMVSRNREILVLNLPTPWLANSAKILRFNAINKSFLGSFTLKNSVGSIGPESKMLLAGRQTLFVANAPQGNVGPGFVDAYDSISGNFKYRLTQSTTQASRSLAVSPDGKFLYVGMYGLTSHEQRIHVHLISTGQLVYTEFLNFGVQAMATHDGSLYVVGQPTNGAGADVVREYEMFVDGTLEYRDILVLPPSTGTAVSMVSLPDGYLDILRRPEGSWRIDRIDINDGDMVPLGTYAEDEFLLPKNLLYVFPRTR